MIPVGTLCLAIAGGHNSVEWLTRVGMECTVVFYGRAVDLRTRAVENTHGVEFKDGRLMYACHGDLAP